MPSPEDLDKLYGLASPTVTATLSFTKEDHKPQTLLIGKQRGDKAEYFAKLASAPAVFAVKKDIRDALEQSSLGLRPLQLWQLGADVSGGLGVQKEGQEYRLKRDERNWKIVEPSEAAAMPALVQPMVTDLASLRSERFEAHAAKDKDLETY